MMKVRLAGVVLIAGTLAVGCSPTDDGEAEETASAQPPTEWDPSDWAPPVEIEPEDLSEEEKLDRHIEVMSRNYPDQFDESPDLEVDTWLRSNSERSELIAGCLQDAGFPAEPEVSGGVRFDPGVPTSQQDALNEARYECDSRFPLDPAYFGDWNDDQLSVVYEYWDDYFIPCMEAHGHTVPRDDQPSKESFVSSFHTPDRSGWNPGAMSFGTLSAGDQESLINVCPPDPPDELLYGT